MELIFISQNVWKSVFSLKGCSKHSNNSLSWFEIVARIPTRTSGNLSTPYTFAGIFHCITRVPRPDIILGCTKYQKTQPIIWTSRAWEALYSTRYISMFLRVTVSIPTTKRSFFVTCINKYFYESTVRTAARLFYKRQMWLFMIYT